MSNDRDEIDAWLQREVTPLYPAPGSFERISRRASARKRRQAITAAVGCAVLVAAVAVAPHLSALLANGSGKKALSASTSTPTQPVTGRTHNGGASPQVQGSGQTQTSRQRTTLTHSWTVPPGHFRPTSVTVVGYGPSFLGAVIGQAGVAGHCATQYCTSLAGTRNYGQSWYGVSAPVAPGAGQPTGVSQLRFADPADGWAFGPALYETSSGGWPWSEVPTNGLRVTGLEAVNRRAFAIAASCSGNSANFAAGCTSFSLYTLNAGSTSWTPLPVPAGYQQMTTAQQSSASLVIAGGQTVYVLTPSGAVLTGPVAGGSWSVAGQAPPGCLPGPAQADGQPSEAQLAAGQNKLGQNELLLACDSPASNGTEQTVLYNSPSGASWAKVGTVPHQGDATSLTAASTGQAVLATTAGILYSGDGGTTWQAASFGSQAAPANGFSYVGLTDPAHGVAVPENASLGEIFVSTDGGRDWTASPIHG